jgi:hypothetical protein
MSTRAVESSASLDQRRLDGLRPFRYTIMGTHGRTRAIMARCMKTEGSRLYAVVAACAVAVHGCDRSESPPAGPESREQLALGLPLETHLSSPVIPDPRYGEASKTIEDALRYLQANQKDGVLHDGRGNEIHFETELIRESGVLKRYPESAVVIKVADRKMDPGTLTDRISVPEPLSP